MVVCKARKKLPAGENDRTKNATLRKSFIDNKNVHPFTSLYEKDIHTHTCTHT